MCVCMYIYMYVCKYIYIYMLGPKWARLHFSHLINERNLGLCSEPGLSRRKKRSVTSYSQRCSAATN